MIPGNIYWTDHGLNLIEVARLSGLYRSVVIAEGLDQPKAIAVHPVKGCVQQYCFHPHLEGFLLDISIPEYKIVNVTYSNRNPDEWNAWLSSLII